MTVRWAILGPGRIAAGQFLPGVRESRALGSSGEVVMVASRDLGRARAFAGSHGVPRAVEGYRRAIEDDEVDAVYVALPHHLHEYWASAALRAGKAVLCEKPLGRDAAEVGRLVAVARDTRRPLWESFVFPFHPQTALVRELLDAHCGPLREVHSRFHFHMAKPDDFRWDPAAGGGALLDVGCYPVRLARLLLGEEPVAATARSAWSDRGVDLETDAEVAFPSGAVLRMSCGVRRPFDAAARLVGERGEVAMTYPFHPGPGDTVTLVMAGRPATTYEAPPGRAFAYGAAHVQNVVAGHTAPRWLAVDDALPQARALDLIRAAALA